MPNQIRDIFNTMHTPTTIIFVGRSGAGKGTQLSLLKEYMEKRFPVDPIVSLDMGTMYRSFFSNDGYVQKIAKDLTMNQGKFQPDFLTNALFVSKAVESIGEQTHLFVDGFPRSVGQLDVMKQLLAYVKRVNPIVVNIEVSRENVKERMLKRGRGDDDVEKIESRLNEYDRTVVPMLEAIKKDIFFRYIEIDGEPTVEEIHTNLVSDLGL